MMFHRAFATALVACFALLAGCASPAPPTPPAAWDTSAVAGVASMLPDATEKLYQAVYSKTSGGSGGPVFGSGDQPGEFKDQVRQIHDEATHLANELANGATKEKTKHSVQRIDELLRDAEESGREELTDSTIGASFDGVQAVMKQLNAFYGVRGM